VGAEGGRATTIKEATRAATTTTTIGTAAEEEGRWLC